MRSLLFLCLVVSFAASAMAQLDPSYLQWVTPAPNAAVTAGQVITWRHPMDPRFASNTPSTYDNGRCIANNAFQVYLTAPDGSRTSIYSTGGFYCPPYNAGGSGYPALSQLGTYTAQATVSGLQLGPTLTFTVIAPSCSLSAVLSSLPANTLAGSCTSSLSLNSTCNLACASSYQVLSGAGYACSTSGVLTGGQTCADPVCSQTSTGNEVNVQVVGGAYTGPTSAALGGVISVSASVPYPALNDPTVVGSFDFQTGGSSSCWSNSAVVGTQSVGGCFLAAPVTGNVFTLSASFVYQKDFCTRFVSTVLANITLVDLARVQSVADAAAAAGNAEVARAFARENALQAATTAVAVNLSSEIVRATGAESVLAGNASALSARVSVLEQAQPSFLFRGLQTGITVSYPLLAQPGAGVASLLNKRIVFDQALSARGSAIIYNAATGVVSITQPGSYRLDAFVHLYTQQLAGIGTGSVGTGVVSWMTLDASPRPIGPNILNPNAAGVPQGTVGDNTFVSTLVTVPDSVSSAAPFTAQCVLVSMNQRQAQITDASVISITKLK